MEDFKVRKIPTAIEGLNSDKVDDYLFSSQRLTNKLIKQYDLVNKLKQLNVGLIVNCQEEGEHPYCGTVYNDGLDENGFAYSTKELEKNGIHVLLCGWLDFVAPDSFNHMIKIVKKMYYYIHCLNKKVLVHCHAGMGRTGTSLACYKIFEKKINAEDARKEIRVGTRKNCLAGGNQYIFCQEFEKYLEILRENFFQKKQKRCNNF
jgi:protein tyrosine phosphatase domain-containing protein 1